jgi:hypothetical protein
MFWDPETFESPDLPIGMKQLGVKRTSELRGSDATESGSRDGPSGTKGADSGT